MKIKTETAKHDTGHSQSRRQVLKTISAAISYRAVAPLALAPIAVTPALANTAVAAKTGIQDSSLPVNVEFRFIDSKSIPGMTALGQGTIINRSTSDIVVNDIAPKVLKTENGQYDVSAYLAEYPIQLASGQQHHFWIRPLHANTAAYGNQRPRMHGSLNWLNSQHTRVLARIDNPSIGTPATEQPFELSISTIPA